MIELNRQGHTVVVEVHGEAGPPVICIPGIGDTRDTWRALAPRLVEGGFRVFVMDLRGHGASDVGFPTYTAMDIGDDIVALLEEQDLHDAVLIGNSIGGGAISHAAVNCPERIARLVMVNPFVRDMPVEKWFRPMVPILFANLWGAWAWGQYRQTLFITKPDDHARNHDAVLANLREPGRMAAVRAMLRASKADVAARLPELAVPILVLMGDKDPDYTDPAAEGETLKNTLLPGPTEVAMVPETGHYPQIERPDLTAGHILRFLKGEEAERGA